LLPKPKTKALLGRFGKLGLTNALIIGGAETRRELRSGRPNIPNVDVLPIQGINVYDILRREARPDQGGSRCAGGALQMTDLRIPALRRDP
jgi:hypothetical protein